MQVSVVFTLSVQTCFSAEPHFQGESLGNSFPNLDYIINAKNFQKIQDCLSEASDMAMLTVDFQGVPVTRHSRCSDYCNMVRSSQHLNDLCRKCDSRGGLEAARIEKPYIYKCHMGLLDFAVPIVVAGHYAGAVLAGQVIVREEEGKPELEQIVNSSLNTVEPGLLAKLQEIQSRIPVMTLDRVQVIANMMFQITNYIIEEAMVKITLNESIDAGFQSGIDSSPVRDERSSQSVYQSPILRPALEYLQHNFEKRISLDEMASLCNISSSYFSKLFQKVTGGNFAHYINRLRVERACVLLVESDLPITVIALDLGFDDNSYFDKVFKRITGMTPSLYRSSRTG